MSFEARELAGVRNPVLLLSAVTWIVLLSEPSGAHFHVHAGGGTGKHIPHLLAMNPPASLAANWFLMLVAMMAPVLISPIRHVRQRSFASRRARSISLFLMGYGVLWMTAGGLIVLGGLSLMLEAPQAYLPAAVVLIIALVWQASPLKQRALNRCHAHTEIAAFGLTADIGALRFGLRHGVWCVCSCWALMLFPMLLPRGHAVAMLAAAVLIFAERLERPMPPMWRWRGLGTLTRALIAQTQIRFQVRRAAASPASALNA